MLNFLKQSRKLVNSKESICIVLGNESCDLDSAVSAITLAYHYQQKEASEAIQVSKCNTQRFLPVLNIPREDYPLKTEVRFLFNQHAICEESLTFRDELHPDFLSRSNVILVDHHVSPFAARCLEVFDHRAYDKTAQLPPTCNVHIEIVGSCATLIAEQVIKDLESTLPKADEHGLMLSLLRSAIILDTVNFSPTAGRCTPKDEDICHTLERLLTSFSDTVPMVKGDELFECLCKARADLSTLTALQLLRKDLKIISNSDDSIKIAIPGFPLLVRVYLTKPDAEAAIQQFVKNSNVAVVLLMGMLVEGNNVTRDLGLINIKNSDLYSALQQKLLAFNAPSLRLELYADCDFMNGSFYNMLNVKATRKHIIPLLKEVLDQWSSAEA